jgi:predicted tellurium resistance membrane protein TerC
MRALFVLVESLVARFRYLDETISIVLGLVGIKLLVEDLVKVGPVVSLIGIAVAFTVGILLSIRGDRRDPDAVRHRQQRAAAMRQGSEFDRERERVSP